jgi:RecJ-like exonuclease
MSDTSTAAGDPDGGPVYRLDPACTRADLEAGERYHAEVNGVVDYGVFVDVSENVSGLVHGSELDGEYGVGDELVVELLEVRENGDLSFAEASDGGETVEREHDYERVAAGTLVNSVGEEVDIEGEVVQIKQTGGPTIFQVRDETSVVPCAAFEAAGVRAFPAIERGDVVHVKGTVEEREGAVQVEADGIERIEGDAENDVRARLDAALAERAAPADIEPLVEWDALDELWDGLERIARRLRRTVLDGRPIRIRHHADGDGMCASVPVQLALERFIDEVHEDPDASRHLLRRSPSKAPFYEMEDATRDLNFALGDRARHGQGLPLLLMLDNGSTEEDVPAYETLDHYDVPVMVVDHHHPDPDAVGDLLEEHVNPYLVGEDYRITTGMLCVELARLIDPELTEELRHVPAVAGLSDRSAAETMEDYLELAGEAGYEEDFLQDVSEALDYEAFWLRYDPGKEIIGDVLNVAGDEERHRELVPFLAERAAEDTAKQMDAIGPHVEEERVANGALLSRVDLENYAHRFTYPAPGKTTGALHDRQVESEGTPVITVGYGPDFAVLRSDGVRLDIPEMVAELQEEIEGGGVHGGGHLVVGSIKFVPGMREEVLDALVAKMADAELDEELQAGPKR